MSPENIPCLVAFDLLLVLPRGVRGPPTPGTRTRRICTTNLKFFFGCNHLEVRRFLRWLNNRFARIRLGRRTVSLFRLTIDYISRRIHSSLHGKGVSVSASSPELSGATLSEARRPDPVSNLKSHLSQLKDRRPSHYLRRCRFIVLRRNRPTAYSQIFLFPKLQRENPGRHSLSNEFKNNFTLHQSAATPSISETHDKSSGELRLLSRVYRALSWINKLG
jgi:hypothetical protein